MSVHSRHTRLTESIGDFHISPFCRTVAYQNDFFTVVFYVGIMFAVTSFRKAVASRTAHISLSGSDIVFNFRSE